MKEHVKSIKAYIFPSLNNVSFFHKNFWVEIFLDRVIKENYSLMECLLNSLECTSIVRALVVLADIETIKELI